MIKKRGKPVAIAIAATNYNNNEVNIKSILKNKTEPKQTEEEFNNDLLGKPYIPVQYSKSNLSIVAPRDDNPVVFLEIKAMGGRKLVDGSYSKPEILGRLYFELRKDIVPIAATNFFTLVEGSKGYGEDGVLYHYKNCRIHRIIKNQFFQSGDLLDTCGNTSKSVFNNGGVFSDENFIFRHTGAGCISYCNRGPDTNGSLFQVVFRENKDLDGQYVVFGCLVTKDSYQCLSRINNYGTVNGEPKEEVRIVDCGVAFSV